MGILLVRSSQESGNRLHPGVSQLDVVAPSVISSTGAVWLGVRRSPGCSHASTLQDSRNEAS